MNKLKKSLEVAGLLAIMTTINPTGSLKVIPGSGVTYVVEAAKKPTTSVTKNKSGKVTSRTKLTYYKDNTIKSKEYTKYNNKNKIILKTVTNYYSNGAVKKETTYSQYDNLYTFRKSNNKKWQYEKVETFYYNKNNVKTKEVVTYMGNTPYPITSDVPEKPTREVTTTLLVDGKVKRGATEITKKTWYDGVIYISTSMYKSSTKTSLISMATYENNRLSQETFYEEGIVMTYPASGDIEWIKSDLKTGMLMSRYNKKTKKMQAYSTVKGWFDDPAG